jgi:superfamily II DNA or RNA helicase
MVASTGSGKYTIVYSLSYLQTLDTYLPTAYICELDKNALPGYQRAVALPDNISSYGVDGLDPRQQELFQLSIELGIEYITDSVNKKNKGRTKSLEQLFEDKALQQTIRKTIDNKLDRFFMLIHQTKVFITIDLMRKVKAHEIAITVLDIEARPELRFVKTLTGIHYHMRLRVGEEVIAPHNSPIQIMAYQPGYLLIGNYIVRLTEIDAMKVKPFLKQESIFIKDTMTKDYFEKFILDMTNKVDDVMVEGFDLIKSQSFHKVDWRPVYDFIQGKWYFDVVFRYDAFSFALFEKVTKKNKLHIEGNNVIVYQGLRDLNNEQAYLDQVRALGYEITENKRLSDLGTDAYSIFVHTTTIERQLPQNTHITHLDIEGKNVRLLTATVMENVVLVNDWFDLQGVIRFGNEDYPFSDLIPYIRSGLRLFKLKDGSYAVIPVEILARFEEAIGHAELVDGRWVLHKMYAATLDDQIHTTSLNNQVLYDSSEIDYHHTDSLRAQLRPYQVDGIKWLIAHRLNGLGALLADDMGLGKTLQTLAALLHLSEQSTVESVDAIQGQQLDLFSTPVLHKRDSLQALIVMPASLTYNWYYEAKKYVPSLQSIIYTGPQRKSAAPTLFTFDLVLTTYQTALSDMDILSRTKWKYIILDESHYIKNRESKIFKALSNLQCEYKLSLSGTPIENSLSDLWSQMEFINPSILGTYPSFKKKYQDPIQKQKDEQVLAALKKIIDPYILRRTKRQVLSELPELIENIHYSEMTPDQTSVFETEKSRARNFLLELDKGEQSSRIHVLSSILRLRQIASHPMMADATYSGDSGKFMDIIEHIDTVCKSGQKVLVFSSFVSMLTLISERLTDDKIDHLMLTGSDSSEDRIRNVERFQRDEDIHVFLISLKAGGTGLNLTAADYVFILDPWWNPKIEEQAIARAHRMGQENNVNVIRFVSRNSIDEKIIKLQSTKRELAEHMIDTQQIPLDDAELRDLLD